MRAPARSTAVATGLVGLIALAGCTSDEPSGSTPTTPVATVTSAEPSPTPSESSSEPSPSSSPSPTALTGFGVDDVRSKSFPDLGGALGDVGAVRVGHHDGFDRVVWEFPGTGTPSYQVRYVDEPIADGSGDPVEVAGLAYLEVIVSRLDIPDSADACPGDASAGSMKGTVVQQAHSYCGGFEGVGQAFVGLDEERPFKVSVLKSPTRIVVDVANG